MFKKARGAHQGGALGRMGVCSAYLPWLHAKGVGVYGCEKAFVASPAGREGTHVCLKRTLRKSVREGKGGVKSYRGSKRGGAKGTYRYVERPPAMVVRHWVGLCVCGKAFSTGRGRESIGSWSAPLP